MELPSQGLPPYLAASFVLASESHMHDDIGKGEPSSNLLQNENNKHICRPGAQLLGRATRHGLTSTPVLRHELFLNTFWQGVFQHIRLWGAEVSEKSL